MIKVPEFFFSFRMDNVERFVQKMERSCNCILRFQLRTVTFHCTLVFIDRQSLEEFAITVSGALRDDSDNSKHSRNATCQQYETWQALKVNYEYPLHIDPLNQSLQCEDLLLASEMLSTNGTTRLYQRCNC